MAKRKPKIKRKEKATRSRPRSGEDESISLHPMKVSEAVSVLLGTNVPSRKSQPT